MFVPGKRHCQVGRRSHFPGGGLRLLPCSRQGRGHLQQACSCPVWQLDFEGSPPGLIACSMG